MVTLKLVHPRWVPGSYTAWVPWFSTIWWDRTKPVTKGLLAHELVHVDQWRRMGISFPIQYFFAYITGGRTHEGNWMEKEADSYAMTPKFQAWAAEVIEREGLQPYDN